MLDPDEPVTIGAMVGPEAFTEVRYLAHAKQIDALDAIPALADEFEQRFGRALGRPARRATAARTRRRSSWRSARSLGTLEEVVDAAREEGRRVGAIALKSFRPFPLEELGRARAGAGRVIVLERAFAVGVGGIVSADVRAALDRRGARRSHTVIAGLGGRAITRRSLRAMLDDAAAGRLEALRFLDLRHRRRRARAAAQPRRRAARARTPRTSSASSASSPAGPV